MQKHPLIVFAFVFLLLTSLPVLATVDPEGESFRDKLREAVQAEDRQAFTDLVKAQPMLCKRAFVVEFLELWESRSEDKSQPLVSELAKLISQEIGKVHGDVKPLQIYDRFSFRRFDVASYELARYAEGVYPAYVGEPILEALNTKNIVKGVHYGAGVERRADYSNDMFYVVYPETLSRLRVAVVEAYLDPNLLIRELELVSKALQLRNQRLREIAPKSEALPKLEQQAKESEEWLKVAARSALVSFGLVSDIDAESLLKIGKLDSKQRLTFLLIRFQSAYRGSRMNEARKHLAAIENIVSESSEEIPALRRFLLKTMQFQSRSDEDSTTDEDVVTNFKAAWNELSEYVPAVKIADDEDWWAARHAVKFWIDELGLLEADAGEDNLRRIFLDLLDWSVEGRDNDILGYYTATETWLQSREVGVYLTQLLSVMDSISYLVENVGMEQAFQKKYVTEALGLLEDTTLKLGGVPKAYSLNSEGSLFPELTLEESSLMRELKLRIGYIKVMTEGKSDQQRVEGLLPLVLSLQGLDRPESSIHYHQLFAREFQLWGRSDLAIPLLEKSLEESKKYGFAKKEVESASTLAEIYLDQDNWERAAFYSERAKSILQSALVVSAPKDGLDIGKQGRSVGELQAVAQLKSNNPRAAFEALSEGQQLESAATQLAVNRRARGDLDSIASKKLSVEVLERQVQALEKLPKSQIKSEVLESNRKQLAKTRSEFMSESRRIRAKYPKLYSTTLRLDSLVLPDVQRALPPGVCVVQYFYTAEEMFIFAVTRDSFRLNSVSVAQRELDKLVMSYVREIRRVRSPEGKLKLLSQKLYSLLVEPIDQDIAQSETLILIPSGRLNLLPFASLQNRSGKALVARKRLVSLAKATDFMKIAGREAKVVRGMVAFANATQNLPSAQKEGEKIKALFPGSKLFVGLEANRDNLLKFASGADVLHLATHGISDPDNAMNNYLALSENGKLTQEEIFNLELQDTSLVTLSACNTAMSDSLKYNFVASIAEAFWIAGSRSVVASVWSVDDDSTQQLMTEFYRGMKEDGFGKAEALQKAQLAVKDNPKFGHPYYWAGFMLFGDYR